MSRKLMPSERFSITFKQSDFLEKESGRLNISKSELLRRMLDFYIEYKELKDESSKIINFEFLKKEDIEKIRESVLNIMNDNIKFTKK
jgi:hypothetical protein